MANNIYNQVLERAEGNCEACGCIGSEMHHICFGSGKRKQLETVESVVLLCTNCHRGTYGVHGREGKKLDLRLKRQLQDKYFSQGYSEDEIRKLMGGKLYG